MTEKYKKKYPKQAKRLQEKINKILSESYNVQNSSEMRTIKTDISFCFFAYGFYPDEYIFFDLGGKNQEPSHRRTFVSETERLCFRFSVNDFTQSIFSDKAEVYSLLQKYFKREAIAIENESDYKNYCTFVNKYPIHVQKIVNSSRGEGVRLIDTTTATFDIKRNFKTLRSLGKVLLEEKIEQDGALAAFNLDSVNTVRVASFKTRNGVIIPYGFFRTGKSGSFVDNAATGGVFAVIDTENGIITSVGYDEAGNKYDTHPNSKKNFKGFRLPKWEQAISLCKEATSDIPNNIGYLSWDLAYSNKGWVIVEVNPSGQFLWQTGALQGCRKEMKQIIQEMEQLVSFPLDRF
ncbi:MULTISPECIES: sugar-transfer associated ATP-grasp domain-containing protein [Eisenbergiella]|uniref:sugar-transfer associated ATP-grasp domain-containing protein n=1 Tax=Eisenbergiella TaxID=1432051 RepID=UPI0023F3FA66|nr:MULTISPECIES: sugar-transfer associated ATP-grasp domain-containing protein [Eisenbergiella]MCI6709822.1 hypothetical protein [Eisenbergiella massiliensis]MDY5528881.1 sugar-transfer associated ATP-grasp domain-containing protein [Eisenbergiella porci]